MKTFFKVLPVLLFLACFLLFPAPVSAVTEGDWSFSYVDGGGARIDRYIGSDTVITIPSEIGGQTVVALGEALFYYNPDDYPDGAPITSVTVPAGVTSVGRYAFYNCRALESVTFQSTSALSLEDAAFLYCSSLETVHFTGSAPVSVGNYMFGSCASLTAFDAASVTAVGEQAFIDCTLLSAVTLAQGAAVGETAFYGCTSLTDIGSNAIGDIGANAFYNCSSLLSASVSASEIPEQAFCGCTALQQITLENVQTIGAYAFNGCSSLESPVFPSALSEIGAAAFQGCESIRTLNLPAGVTAIGDNAFYACTSLSSVSLSEPLASIGRYAFAGSDLLAEVDIPDTVTDFGEYPFKSTTTLIVGQGTQAQAFAGANGYPTRIRGSAAMVEVGLDAVTAQEKVEAIVASYITDDMSDYEKALVLHDYLITFADYDSEAEDRFAPEAVLLHGGGVCQSYTMAYQMLLNAVGITNDTETGTEHIWNMIQLGAKWYHIDCTWDDPTGGGHENHNFFCVTDYVLDGFDSHERFSGAHQATSLDMNYLWLTGGLNSRISAIESLADSLLSEGGTTGSITDSPFAGKYNIAADRLAVEYWQGQMFSKDGETAVLSLDYTSTPNTSTSPVNDFAVTLSLVRITDLGSIRVDPGRSFTLGVCEGQPFEFSMSPADIVTADADGVLTAVRAGTAALTLTGETHIYTLEISVSVLNTFTLPASLTLLEEDALSEVPAQAVIVPAGMPAPDGSFFAGLDSLCLLVLQGSTPIPDPSLLPEGILVLYPEGVIPADAGYFWGHSAN